MDPSVTTNSSDKEFHVTSANKSSLDPDVDVDVTVIPSNNSDNVPTITIDSPTIIIDSPTIIIDSLPNNNDLTVTPAFPNFPTDEEVVRDPETVVHAEPTHDITEQENTSKSSSTSSFRPSQQTSQILDELKYLLKPTNSLARPEVCLQASQETDAAIKRRTMEFDEDALSNSERLLIEGLSPDEVKSLGAAGRRSSAARSQHLLNILPGPHRSRAATMQPSITISVPSRRSTIQSSQSEHRTIFDHLSGYILAFFAAYAFSIILFLTKIFGIDLIFGFFLQTIVQTIAFSVYAFYKGYNLLGPTEHRIAMIFRGLLIGIGALTSFLAYYYISLPELSAIRQIQIILTIILSIFFLHERVTISRIIACIVTVIAIIILIRPTTIGASSSSSTVSNLTNYKTSWTPYSSPWADLIGISFALCTAITYSIASIMNKIYFSTEQLHNSVLCFWSALSALIISSILLYVTHFVVKDASTFPHDWRLFFGIALALVSIFVFIANQKAIKRKRSSIVTLIYSTDIILAFILQNLFTHNKSDAVVILGCLLILASILIICIEVLLMEKRKNKLATKVAEIVNKSGNSNNLPVSLDLKTAHKRLSI